MRVCRVCVCVPFESLCCVACFEYKGRACCRINLSLYQQDASPSSPICPRRAEPVQHLSALAFARPCLACHSALHRSISDNLCISITGSFSCFAVPLQPIKGGNETASSHPVALASREFRIFWTSAQLWMQIVMHLKRAQSSVRPGPLGYCSLRTRAPVECRQQLDGPDSEDSSGFCMHQVSDAESRISRTRSSKQNRLDICGKTINYLIRWRCFSTVMRIAESFRCP